MDNNKYVVARRGSLPSSYQRRNFVREHVVVAENMIGRELINGESVHHIDGNKSNNDPSNLMVFATNSDHISFHNGHEAYVENGVWRCLPLIRYLVCAYCGNRFEKEKGRKVLEHVFCSKECFDLSQRRIFRNQNDDKVRDELLIMLFEANGNFSKVSKHYGISGNGLRKHCARVGLPTHSYDYKIH